MQIGNTKQQQQINGQWFPVPDTFSLDVSVVYNNAIKPIISTDDVVGNEREIANIKVLESLKVDQVVKGSALKALIVAPFNASLTAEQKPRQCNPDVDYIIRAVNAVEFDGGNKSILFGVVRPRPQISMSDLDLSSLVV